MEVVVVFVFPFPMPHSPHKMPGMLNSRKPRQAFIQPNPFVLPLAVVSVITSFVIFVLLHLGHIIMILSFV